MAGGDVRVWWAVVGSRRLVAVVGVEDVVIRETDDALLVLRCDNARDVKKIVDETIQENSRCTLESHVTELTHQLSLERDIGRHVAALSCTKQTALEF
jgi:hypothetical protein